MLNTTTFTAAHQANLDAMMALTAKAFKGIEQLTALNLQAVKSTLEEASHTGTAALTVKDPQALLAMQMSLLQPATDKATAYGKQVYGIVTGLQADIEKAAADQAVAAQSAFTELIEAAAKNAPEGSGSGVALFKSAMATANNAYDSLNKAGKQAAEAAEANFTAMTGAVTKASGKSKRA